jgi:hypothetical protein
MPRTSAGFATVREVGRTIPNATEGTAYGSPALKVGRHMFACLAVHRSAEPNTLVVRVPYERRAELIRDDPDAFYVKPHYQNYPSVLVRLKRIRPDELRRLLEESATFVASGASLGPRPKSPRSKGTVLARRPRRQ